MRPKVATVLTARPWESALVEAARASAAVRVVTRAYGPDDIDTGAVDAVVAGAETAWISPAQIRSWRLRGTRVLGVYPAGDEPGRSLLARGGADETVPDNMTSFELLDQIRLMTLSPAKIHAPGMTVGVVGPRGSPGRTEVALALSTSLQRIGPTILVDLDLDGPSLSLRLGLGPEPSIVDIGEAVRAAGRIPTDLVRPFDGVDVATGAFGHRSLPDQAVRDIVLAAGADYPWVVADLGQVPRTSTPLPVDRLVAVCDASPTGLVRAADMMMRWEGPAPFLVVNRLGRNRRDVLEAARRATGLEPVGLIPYEAEVRRAAVTGQRPTPRFGRALDDLVGRLLDSCPLTRGDQP